MKQSLNGAWQITRTTPGVAEPMTFTGTVPGCVLNDLLRNGYGPENVFWRDHAEQVQHFENDSWCYRRVFSVSEPTDHAELVFERLDTYCDVYLNGKYVGSGDNGYIPHRFSVGDQLQTGENSVEVYFQSPIVRTAGQKPSSGAFTTERIRTRRVQCTYGWDWTMRFVTCGIGDAALVFPEVQPMRPEHVYVYTKCVDEDGAALGIDVRFAEPCAGALLTFRVCDDQNQTVYNEERWCAEPFLRLNPDIAHPKLWYPAGYGAQPLYRLIIQWGDRVLHTTEFGIRTVRILQLKDEPGTTYHTRCMELKTTDFSERYDQNAEFSGFVLKINGVKILCRGANWVPCEPFTTDGIPQKITRHLEMAKEAGVNMLRVWGGGAIECEHFYDECARLGILVTQDFLMACGRYPEEEDWFIEALQKEATYATLLLRNKACLVWWSGDNENAVGGTDLDENYPGRRSAYKGIAPILYKLDPQRAFFPSSPYGGRKYASHTVGTTHNTQFLSFFFKWLEESDLSDYKEMLQKYSARFIAEEPTMGACSWNTLKTFMTEADILGDDNRMWLYHTKGNPALQRDLVEYMELFAEKVLGAYTDGADRFFKRKYVQYEWMRVSMERVRRDFGFCNGVIYWMMEDCWPAAAGWAIVDYRCMPKAAFYVFRRLAAHTTASVDLAQGYYRCHVSNDRAAVSGKVTAQLVKEGRLFPLGEPATFTAPENGAAIVWTLPEAQVPEDGVLIVDMILENGDHDRAFYRKGTLHVVPCAPSDYTVAVNDHEVTVTANRYIHALELEGDALFEDSYFSLLPGETRTISFRGLTPDFTPADIRIQAYTLKE